MSSQESAWEILASTPRWRGVVALIRNWVGPLDHSNGIPPESLEVILRATGLSLPAAVVEWQLLTGRWEQGGTNVWLRPQDMVVHEERILVLSDIVGGTGWQIRTADVAIEDPPTYRIEYPDQISYPTFSQCVAAMVINDVLFADGNYIELNPKTARSALIDLNLPNLYADAPLESASILAFDYFGDGPVCAKSRTDAGRSLVEKLRV